MNEYFQLDMLTLNKISEEAGKPLDKSAYLESLAKAATDGLLFETRKGQQLQGYFMLRNLEPSIWFVSMFVVHPEHRNKVVFTSLFSQLASFVKSNQVDVLVSNVLRNNELSVNFHRRLGFVVTRENDLGYEFQLTMSEKVRTKWRYLEKYC